MASNESNYEIKTFSITKKFGNLTAVDNVNLSINTGELFSILGPNGAGKTTIIKMLCCLLKPTSGTATIKGLDIVKDAHEVKKIIDISPQETAIADHLNSRENLMMMAGIYNVPKEEANKRTDELLRLFGLSDRANEQVRKFSGGMKRRLSIAMSLISDPEILFLDEPTLGLDPEVRRRMWHLIENLKGKKTVILTTHYLEEADALADRVLIIDKGKIIALDTPERLKSKLHGMQTMTIKAKNVTDACIDDLKKQYPHVIKTEAGIEIRGDELDFDSIVDYLRKRGVKIEKLSMKEATLDDVFLKLTGKEMVK
jgi:ABC-2 type transport system ATP-binding protein